MEIQSKTLNRGEKILSFLYELGIGDKKRFAYEDIVVGLFKKYPKDFCLKGYPKYPDSSDSTQRLLYEFKKKGYITAANKIFSLTDTGVEFAKKIMANKSTDNNHSPERTSRATAVETNRIKNLEGFVLFIEGKTEQITESDFYNYLGISAKTTKSVFSGRIKNIEAVIKEIREEENDPLFSKIIKYHDFLTLKYTGTVNYFLK